MRECSITKIFLINLLDSCVMKMYKLWNIRGLHSCPKEVNKQMERTKFSQALCVPATESPAQCQGSWTPSLQGALTDSCKELYGTDNKLDSCPSTVKKNKNMNITTNIWPDNVIGNKCPHTFFFNYKGPLTKVKLYFPIKNLHNRTKSRSWE